MRGWGVVAPSVRGRVVVAAAGVLAALAEAWVVDDCSAADGRSLGASVGDGGRREGPGTAGPPGSREVGREERVVR